MFCCLIHSSSLLQDLIDIVVAAAKASADNLICSEGWGIQLKESLDLRLPFLLPEGGYSCVTVRGIPAGLREFLEPICQKGVGYLQKLKYKYHEFIVSKKTFLPEMGSVFDICI